MLELRLFGGFHLSGAGLANEGITAEKGFLAVLAVVAAAGDKGISRDALSVLFWPESDTKRARGSLKQAIYSLRHEISPELFVGRAVLRLNPAVVESDVARFDEALGQGRFEDAVDVYRGEFLAGFNGTHSIEFERWLDRVRSEFARQYRTALEKLCAAADRSGNQDEKQRWLIRLVEHDLLDVDAVLRLVDTLRGLGQIARALQYATRHANAMQSELESAPDERITEIVCCLRQKTSKSNAIPVVEHEKQKSSAEIQSGAIRPLVADSPHTRAKVWARRATLGAVVALLAFVLVPSSHRTRPVGVTLGRFVNLSSDRSADEYADNARQWVRNDLSGSGLIDSSSLDQAKLDRASEVSIDEQKYPTVVRGQVDLSHDTLSLTAYIIESGSIVSSVGPVSVPRNRPACGMTILAAQLSAALGRPFGSKSFPMMSFPSADSRWESYCSLYSGIHSRSEASLTSAVRHDSTFLLPLLPLAQIRLEHGDIGSASSDLSKLDVHRSQLDPLNRIWLDYLIGESNKDFSFSLRAAQRGSDRAPQSVWSLVAADMLVRSDRPQDAVLYLNRLDPDLPWILWDEKQQNEYWRVRLQIAHRLGEKIERKELSRATRIVPRLPSVRIAAALRFGLSGREVEMLEVVRNLLAEADSSRDDFVRRFSGRGPEWRKFVQARLAEPDPRREQLASLIAELECHGSEAIAAKVPLDLSFSLSDSGSEGDRRSKVFANLERGQWWSSQYRLRELLEAFPKSEFRSEYLGRLMFVDAVMHDTAEALRLVDSVEASRSIDPAMAYWMTATDAWVRKFRKDSSLFFAAVKAGYGRTLSRHSRAVDIRAFWSAAPRPLPKAPVRCITETDPSWKSSRTFGELNPR